MVRVDADARRNTRKLAKDRTSSARADTGEGCPACMAELRAECSLVHGVQLE